MLFISYLLLIIFTVAYCGDVEKLISLYNAKFQDANVIKDSYEVLDTLLGLHKTDHKVFDIDGEELSRQDLVNVRKYYNLHLAG